MTSEQIINEDVLTEDQSNIARDNDSKALASQQDSAYGSLESSSNGQSQRSYDGSGSKSQISGSSHSSSGRSALKVDGSSASTKGKKIKEISSPDLREQLSQEENNSNLLKNPNNSNNLHEEIHPNESTKTEPITNDNNCIIESDKGKNRPSLVYTQALNYIRKIKERSAEQGLPFDSPYLNQLTTDRHDVSKFFHSFNSSRGFVVAISIQDGSVLYVSSSITEILGFPKDMLLGQSFIDFVYPKDSINFSSKIINGLNFPFREDSIKDNYGTTFFCRLRMYHSLRKSGFGVRNKQTYYKPCKVIFKPQDVSSLKGFQSSSQKNLKFSLIIAEMIPIDSAYQSTNEPLSKGTFIIRHSASCNFSEYDPEAIPYLGHLPQDLTGNSIFDCYHPEDLTKLKKIYEEIVKHQGRPYRSEPYRFRTFNNSWVTLATEWLCFVNPWTKKIESIIGQHKVLQGPKDISIFVDSGDKSMSPLPEELLQEIRSARTEILELLQKPVPTYLDPSKEPTVKRRRTLADMMGPLVEEMDSIDKKYSLVPTSSKEISSPGCSSNKKSSQARGVQRILPTSHQQQSIITPGQESLNSSNETSSSYGQLNYSATLQRFFRSNPKTISSDEHDVTKTDSEDASNHHQHELSEDMKSYGGSEDNDAQVQKITFDDGNANNELCHKMSAMGNSLSSLNCPLTVEMLLKHNQDMQKKFMDCQKQNKYSSKVRPTRKISKRVREKLIGLRKINQNHDTIKKRELYKKSNIGGMIKSSMDTKPTTPSSKLFQTVSSSLLPHPALERVTVGHFPSMLPNFLVPPNGSSMPSGKSVHSSLHSQSSVPFGTSSLVMTSQSSFVQPTAMPLPVQYMGAIPSVVYQPIGPALLNPHPLMLPNVVYQHTLIQPPIPTNSSAATSAPPNFEGSLACTDGMDRLEIFDSELQKMHLPPIGTSDASKASSLFADTCSVKSCTGKQTDGNSRNYTSSNLHLSDHFLDENSSDEYEKSQPSTKVNVRKEVSIAKKDGKPSLRDPPWMKNAEITPEMLLKYQLKTQELVEVLRQDMGSLKDYNQPSSVNEQLASLYCELDCDDSSPELHLEEGITSSSSDDQAVVAAASSRHHSLKSRKMTSKVYTKLSMLYEEEAPMPSVNEMS